MRRELHTLSAALKRSLPCHGPRHLGHMVSDLLLPSLAAYMLTLPYNPNNVSAEAAPVTVDLELRADLQLARMVGFCSDPQALDCAYGHLCSGGTVANLQGLRLALALKAFPVALRAVAAPLPELPDDDWTAFNLPPAQALSWLQRWQRFLRAVPPRQRPVWRRRLDAERLERLGLAGFMARHPSLLVPRVLVPATAHYSWSKGVKLLGLGRDQLVTVPEQGMRLHAEAFDALLHQHLARRHAVLVVVPVLGSTEFGTVDPVDAVVAARERWATRGLGFAVHVDAAWGDYLASLFRTPEGGLRPLSAMQAEHAGFPSAAVHAAFGAIGQADSVTVDPHKLGFIAYGAGAFIARDRRAMPLLMEGADYVFDGDDGDEDGRGDDQPGRYAIEGSKPGATAAAVYVSHRVLPLDHRNFGSILSQGVHAAQRFHAAAAAFAARSNGLVRACVPFEPDSNLVTLAMNPAGNRDLAAANRFMRALHQRLRVDGRSATPPPAFIGSITTLRPDALGAAAMAEVFDRIGIDARAAADAEGRLFILRHTLMNPYLVDDENSISYIERYFDHLSQEIAALLAQRPDVGRCGATPARAVAPAGTTRARGTDLDQGRPRATRRCCRSWLTTAPPMSSPPTASGSTRPWRRCAAKRRSRGTHRCCTCVFPAIPTSTSTSRTSPRIQAAA